MNSAFLNVVTRAFIWGQLLYLLSISSFAAEPMAIGWGNNTWGAATAPPEATNLTAISAGGYHSLGLKTDGTVLGWGHNGYAQATPPAGLSNVVAIAAGWEHSLALKGDGTVAAWGDNYYREAIVPAGLSNVVAIAAGGPLSVALKNDGTVVAWGTPFGTNVPPDLSNVVAIAAGGDANKAHGLALRKDGTAVGWGHNYDYSGAFVGQATVPAGLSNVVAIAAGGYHSIALKRDGTLKCWGGDGFGVTSSVPAGLTNAVAIAAGEYFSIALKSDGTAVAWGGYFDGAAWVTMAAPAGLTNLVAVSGGSGHCIALQNDGTPRVLWPPADRQTIVGVPVCLDLGAAGPGLLYQWEFAGNPLDGATNSVLTLMSPQMADSGVYRAIVSNPFGRVLSANATLTVLPSAPIILSEPDDQSVFVGSNVVLSVRAAGTVSLDYQWRHEGTNVPGAMAETLLLPNIQPPSTGVYEVYVSNYLGWTVSRRATVKVYSTPEIEMQPTNCTAIIGSRNIFMVFARSLPPLTFQWRFHGTNIPGATDSTLILGRVRFEDAGPYQVIVSNPLSAVVSDSAALSVVDGPPVIVSGPGDQEGCLGGAVVFQVSSGGTPPLHYQWLLNGHDLPGETHARLQLVSLSYDQLGTYSVVVTNEFGSATSSGASLVMSPVLAWGDNSFGQTNLPPGLINTVALAAGGRHNLALRKDGTVVAWGANLYGQCDVPPGLSNASAIAASDVFSLALLKSGMVVGWGQVSLPEGLTNISAIAAGGAHGLALRNDGTVAAWGRNDNGQASVPSGLTNVIAIAAGVAHSLAVTRDGAVVGWGSNISGETVAPKRWTNAVAVAAGLYNSLALWSDGNVSAWGFNPYGESTVPAGLKDVVVTAAGYYHCLALRADGSVSAWGYNGGGQVTVPSKLNSVLGVAAGEAHSLAFFNPGPPIIMRQPSSQTKYSGATVLLSASAIGPGPINYQWEFNGKVLEAATNASLLLTNLQPQQAGFYRVTAVSPLGRTASSNANLTILVSAPVITGQPESQTAVLGPNASNLTLSVIAEGSWPLSYQWSHNGTALAGATASSLTITNVQMANRGIYVVTVSNALGMARSEDAVLSIVPLVAWGSDSYSQTQVPLSALDVVAVVAGYNHNLGLRRDGIILAWGYNNYGQCSSPLSATNVVSLAAGANHSLALRADGSLVAWGYNGNGQLNSPAGATNLVAIAAGGNQSLVLRADGRVMAWGQNISGQSVPLGAVGVVAIAAGADHCLALRADGSVVAWGQNVNGQCAVPKGATNLVAICAGAAHSVALRADGNVIAWGANTYGQATVPPDATNVASIAAGAYHTLAVRSDGTVVTWGSSAYGLGAVPGAATNTIAAAGGRSHSLLLLGDGSPKFVSQAWNRTVAPGTAVAVRIPAVGMAPLSFQWQRNGNNVPGATNALLIIGAVGLANSGQYTLVVSNELGSITSAAFKLDLERAATMLAPDTTSQGFLLRFAGVPGLTYSIHRSQNLQGAWLQVGTTTVDYAGFATWTDTSPPPASAYYRAVFP